MREREIEKWLREQIKNLGGRALKFTSPGNDGVPDRIVFLPGGRVYLVELKAIGGRLSPIQVWQQENLRRLGIDVRTITGRAEAEAFIRELKGGETSEVHTSRLSETRDSAHGRKA